jgi:hypothetical protein
MGGACESRAQGTAANRAQLRSALLRCESADDIAAIERNHRLGGFERSIMHCTLLIPNLVWPRDIGHEPYSGLDLPALARLLSRGRCTVYAQSGMEEWLCTAFEVERQHDWPVAPLTLVSDGGEPDSAYWLRCDPVHLRPQRAQLQLVHESASMPTAAEAHALAATLNSHFSAERLVFQPLQPERWYLALDHSPNVVTHALPEVCGKDINRFLPQGDGLRWHRLLNEIQMLWHEHPVNAAREGRGAPSINSVWLWGGGVTPAVPGRPFTSVWSDDALAIALAVASDAALHALPENARALLDDTQDGEKTLAVLPALRAAAAAGDAERWRAALELLERNWFAPLLTALRERRLADLAIVMLNADECRRYDISRFDVWKFWRASRPLAEHA